MADTTLTAIMQRFQVVLEGHPLYLSQSRDAFSHDTVPNNLLDSSYHVRDGGIADQRPMGNYKAARIDRLVVHLARKVSFEAQDASESLQTLLNTVERYIKADGPNNDYRAELDAREVARVDETDIVIAQLTFSVDYDYNEATS